jgi:hypothetical protein
MGWAESRLESSRGKGSETKKWKGRAKEEMQEELTNDKLKRVRRENHVKVSNRTVWLCCP